MKKEDSGTRATSLQLKIDIESRTDVVFLTGVNITQTNPFILTVPALNKPLKHGSCPAHDFTWLNLWQGTNLRLRIGLGHHKQYLRCCQARWGTSYRESTKKNEDVVFSFPEWWGDHVPNAALGGFNPMTFTTIAWASCLEKKRMAPSSPSFGVNMTQTFETRLNTGKGTGPLKKHGTLCQNARKPGNKANLYVNVGKGNLKKEETP